MSNSTIRVALLNNVALDLVEISDNVRALQDQFAAGGSLPVFRNSLSELTVKLAEVSQAITDALETEADELTIVELERLVLFAGRRGGTDT